MNRLAHIALFTTSLASPAFAQVEFTGIEAESFDAAALANPQAKPGHDKGDREKSPEPDQPGEPPFAPDWFGSRPFADWARLTGNWAGLRDTLESRGIELSASYTLDWSAAWAGAASSRATYRSLFDANVTLDLDPLFGLAGGSVFADFYSTHKSGGSEDVGDFQGFSSIETEQSLDQLAELWYEQKLFSETLRLKAGKIDANAEFGFPSRGVDYLNSSAYYSPTIFALPSYPDPATGCVAFLYPTKQWYIGGGWFDGASTIDGVPTGTRGPSTFFSDADSDDWFFIGEAGLTWVAEGGRPGRLSGGELRHTGQFQTWDGGEQSGATGIYALVEQRVWSRDENAESEQGLHLFAQFGWSEDEVAEATMHAAIGLSAHGPWQARPDDSLGAYVSWVKLNRDAGYQADETVFEIFYTIQILQSVNLKPDLQVIVNPGGDQSLDTGWIGSLRLEVEF